MRGLGLRGPSLEVAGAGLSSKLAGESPPPTGASAALRFLGLGVVALFSRPDAIAQLAILEGLLEEL